MSDVELYHNGKESLSLKGAPWAPWWSYTRLKILRDASGSSEMLGLVIRQPDNSSRVGVVP